MLTENAKKAVREIAVVGCFVLAFSCAVDAAIPSEYPPSKASFAKQSGYSGAECKAARAKLAELTSDDYKALKAKTKTNEQVGDALAQYADNEESAAGKFALLQDAFQQYVLGKSVDKAESVYSKAQSIGGVEYALEMARPSRSKLSAYAISKNAPAKALNERIMADEKSLQRVGIVKAKLKKAPGDESLCEQLGIEYAAIGDWESALAAFVTAAGEVAKVADWELNGGKGVDYTAATVGAFWWKFADNFPKRKNVEEAMKLHAAMWYKLALDKDAFKGNEKTIIEKRIAETEKFGAAERAEKELAAKKMTTLDPIKLEFTKDNFVELTGCPAGEFVMGCSDDKKSSQCKHKVKITRPFWMSKYKITHKVWNAYQKYELNKQDQAFGGWNRVHSISPIQASEFFDWLNKRKTTLKPAPKGYVFRLPTEAEWEYALNANVTDDADIYVRKKTNRLANPIEICVDFAESCQKCKNQSLVPQKCWELWGVEVGTKKPNALGLYDMLGNLQELTLDTLNMNLLTGWRGLLIGQQTAILYAELEVDPLRCFEGAASGWIRRGGHSQNERWGTEWFYKSCATANQQDGSIRIVLGPDLMKEKGYTAKAKKR